jgi:hypothetical protein
MLPFHTKWFSVGNYGVVDLLNIYISEILDLRTIGYLRSDNTFVS